MCWLWFCFFHKDLWISMLTKGNPWDEHKMSSSDPCGCLGLSQPWTSGHSHQSQVQREGHESGNQHKPVFIPMAALPLWCPPENIAANHPGDVPSPGKNDEQEELLIQRGSQQPLGSKSLERCSSTYLEQFLCISQFRGILVGFYLL